MKSLLDMIMNDYGPLTIKYVAQSLYHPPSPDECCLQVMCLTTVSGYHHMFSKVSGV